MPRYVLLTYAFDEIDEMWRMWWLASIVRRLWCRQHYVLGSAFFAALTMILSKDEITGVEANFGIMIRTGLVLRMVAVAGKLRAPCSLA